MQIESDLDFDKVRDQIKKWKHEYPSDNLKQVENNIENHIKQYYSYLITYKHNKNNKYLQHATLEIDEINKILKLLEKLELMTKLSNIF